MLKLRKDLEMGEGTQAELETALQSGGMLLLVDRQPKSRDLVELELFLNGTKAASLQAEVVYSAAQSGKYQVGLELKGEWQKSIQEVLEKLEKGEEGKSKQWGQDSTSIYHRVKEMEMHEKIKLAINGNREERRILLKDAHYMVHPYVLKNPRLTSDEVAQISRMGSLTQEMIRNITENAEWMSNAAVRLAIVKNPKTPINVVQKYIGQLGDNDLMILAKSESVREAISKSAKRVLASRGKVIR